MRDRKRWWQELLEKHVCLVLENGSPPSGCLADVRKPGEAKKAVADADLVPKPKVVKTGTDGD
jgi:hypothetical protein